MQPRRFATINTVLLIVIILLVNLVSRESFLRLDLTAAGAYSLSEVSRETVSRAEDPLQVKVFYSDNVPPPYNGVRRYLLDLLREYQALGDGRFSYEVVDTSTPEGRSSAAEYGIQQVEIQEVRSDEFQSRAVHLGAAVLYAGVAETVDRITDTGGLEYRLTTAMRRAITRVDALAGSLEPVTMRVIRTPGLENLQIEGLAELPETAREIHQRVNRDNYDRISFEFVEPREDQLEATAEEFDLQPLRWQDAAGVDRRGLLEIVLSRGDRHQVVPLEVFSGFFGGYSLDDPEAIEDAVRRGLRTLVAANPRVGYVRAAGERALEDYRQGAGPFAELLRERYELVPVDPATDPVPADIDLLVLNGPRREYSQAALYRIDQFVMNGGSILVFLDRYDEQVPSQQEMMMGAQPEWSRITSGLEGLLGHYGVELTDQVVLDEEAFVTTMQGRRITIHQAPVLQGQSLNRDHVVTRGLEDVIVLNATEILDRTNETGRDKSGEAGDTPGGPVRFVPLLETSPRSWTVEHPADAGPWLDGVPPGVTPDRRVVAALLEGAFESYYAVPPVETDRHRVRSIREGRILLVSTSELTTAQLLDPQQRTPNGTFLMNAVDYLKGAPAFAELRSKGLGVARLEIANPAVPGIVRWSNVILVPLLVVFIGLVVHRRRIVRSRRIQQLFEGEDRA